MTRSFTPSVAATLIAAGLFLLPVLAGAKGPEPVARLSAGSASIDWQPVVSSYEELVLTISTPGGQVIRREFAAGDSPKFSLFDAAGKTLREGSYTYELRVVPVVDPATRERLKAYRGGDRDIPEELRQSGKLPQVGLVQSGSFAIIDGAFVAAGEVEPAKGKPSSRAKSGKALTNVTANDQVIPDDLIVQGRACIGFDCVNNEPFVSETIRLKQTDTRIRFEDTSVGAFPANDWQLTANESASGGQNKFSIEDLTGTKIPFTVTAGAPTNSIFVDSTGRVGFQTSTPVLDLHVNTDDTPGFRLEQNASGGFPAQSWDIAGNEASFFIHDATAGSSPLIINAGAPTNSINIAASGNVGIGTTSPTNRLDVKCNAAAGACGRIANSSATGFSGWEFTEESGTVVANISVDNAANNFRLNAIGNFPIVFLTESTERIRIPSPGGNLITAANGAFLSAGGVWTNASSRSYKEDIVDLSGSEALEAIKRLDPIKFRYKSELGEQYVGFIAEDVPELVGMNDHKSLNPMDIVAVLTKVVQEQQKTIEALSAKVDEMEKANKK